jgi:deazaflavin-dependent oxidoreductase (nitroreductase family)
MASPLPRPVYLAIGTVLTHPRFHPIHRRLYRWTGGRGPVGRALGMDMILVTMRGRRTGRSRVVPLAAVPDGDRWLLVGSNAGKDRMPAWVHNLREDGRVEVESPGGRGVYLAHEAVGDEASRAWALVVAAYPGYAVYRERTARSIPVFILEPLAAEA